MRFLYLASFLFLGGIAYSQESGHFEVFESSREFSDGPQNALVIEMPGVKERMADKVWKDYLGKYKGKLKRAKEMKGEVASEMEIFPIGGYEKLNVYSRMESSKTNSTLIVWFERKGIMLSSSQDAKSFQEAISFMRDYGHQVHIAQVEELLAEEEKSLKSIEKDLDRLKRDNDSYHKDIANARDRIAKAEKQIEENNQAQGRTQELIQQQLVKVKEVNDRIQQLKR